MKIFRWSRKCQECLHIQSAQKPEYGTEPSDSYRGSKCRKCKSEALDYGKEHYASGNMIRKDIKVKEGIDKETAKKIVKAIKESGIKVQASIMDEQVRVTGKKLDDLQIVIAMVKKMKFELPLQYINFRN